VIDHDVRVLARKMVRVKAFRLGPALDWAVAQARAEGFAAVTVACEPAGPRWLQVQMLCAERGLPLVCIQPLVSHIAREQQDLHDVQDRRGGLCDDRPAGRRAALLCPGGAG